MGCGASKDQPHDPSHAGGGGSSTPPPVAPANKWDALDTKIPWQPVEARLGPRLQLWTAFDVNNRNNLTKEECFNGCVRELGLGDLFPSELFIANDAAWESTHLLREKADATDNVDPQEWRLYLRFLRDDIQLAAIFMEDAPLADVNDLKEKGVVSRDAFFAALDRLAGWGADLPDPEAVFREVDLQQNGAFVSFVVLSDWLVKNRLDRENMIAAQQMQQDQQYQMMMQQQQQQQQDGQQQDQEGDQEGGGGGAEGQDAEQQPQQHIEQQQQHEAAQPQQYQQPPLQAQQEYAHQQPHEEVAPAPAPAPAPALAPQPEHQHHAPQEQQEEVAEAAPTYDDSHIVAEPPQYDTHHAQPAAQPQPHEEHHAAGAADTHQHQPQHEEVPPPPPPPPAAPASSAAHAAVERAAAFSAIPMDEARQAAYAAAVAQRAGAWQELASRLPRQKTKSQNEARSALFKQFDPEEKGAITFGQAAAGADNLLNIRAFYPTMDFDLVYQKAFGYAANARTNAELPEEKRTDAFDAATTTIERNEFRLFLVYLYNYLDLCCAFDGMGLATEGAITYSIFASQLVPLAESWGVAVPSPQSVFQNKLDTLGLGMITFYTFSEWAIERQIEAQTIAAEAKKEKKKKTGGEEAGASP